MVLKSWQLCIGVGVKHTVDSKIFTAIILHFITFHVVYFSSLGMYQSKVKDEQ